MKGMIVIDPERCKECGFCIEFCPKKLIQKGKQRNSRGFVPAVFSDPEQECIGCGFCYLVCPDVAIEVWRKTETEGGG